VPEAKSDIPNQMMDPTGPNAEQIQFWSETAGLKWVDYQQRIDAHVRLFGLLAINRAAIMPGERALDVGCGCGDAALELARRVETTGKVAGIDISFVMLDRARQLAKTSGFTHLDFVNADAQTYAFVPSSFDLLYSRFGVMFFADPQAAFANLFKALCPGGRFSFVCWQELKKNPWALVSLEAVAKHIEVQPSMPDAPGPFAFANPDRVSHTLSKAGFRDLNIEGFIEEVAVGGTGNLDEAVDFLMQMGPAAAAIRKTGTPEKRSMLVDALRHALAPYQRSQGVQMPAAVWIVTGKRPS
jgi:ubiquinone/menaquinone biosynthesis C-methylase UbiE